MRAPGYVMLPFDRPVHKRYSYDDPDHPEDTPEIRADVVEIARLYRSKLARTAAAGPSRANPPVAMEALLSPSQSLSQLGGYARSSRAQRIRMMGSSTQRRSG